MNIPDNEDIRAAHDIERERWLEELPVCIYCKDPIQDDFYFKFDSKYMCETCLNDHHRKMLEDYT